MSATKKPKEDNVYKHFYLGALKLDFISPDGVPLDVNINVVVSNETNLVNKGMLEKMQVQAQVQLSNSLGGVLPEVKHVFIQSVSYLGYMTDGDFLVAFKPEGTKH